MKRAFLNFACAFLLVNAQLSALTHSVWHLHELLPAHGQQSYAGAVQDGGGEAPSSQAELCVFHAMFGSLSTAACAGQSALSATDLSDSLSTFSATWHFAQSAVIPPSRAPPVLI